MKSRRVLSLSIDAVNDGRYAAESEVTEKERNLTPFHGTFNRCCNNDIHIDIPATHARTATATTTTATRAVLTPAMTITTGSSNKFHTIVSLCLYCLCSILLTLLNKAIVYTYKMDHAISLILTFQLLTAIGITLLAKHVFQVADFPDFNWRTAVRFIPLSVAYIVMLQSSLLAFSKISVPLFNTLKNMSTVITCLGEVYLLNQRGAYSLDIYLSFLCMMLGSVLTVLENFSFTPMGLLYSGINIISTSAYLLYMKYLLTDKSLQSLGKAGPALYSNIVSVPVLIAVVIIRGEYRLDNWYHTDSHILFNTWTGIISLLLLLLIGGSMSFATNYCIKFNSCTTYSMAGSLNKIPLALFGILLFAQYPSLLGWTSISIGLLGGILYSYLTVSTTKGDGKKTDMITTTAITSRKQLTISVLAVLFCVLLSLTVVGIYYRSTPIDV